MAYPNPTATAGVAELKGVSADAEAIRTFADLAQKAAGAIEITSLSPPPGSVGLPSVITVARHAGKEPALKSLKSLFDDWRDKPARRSGVAMVTTLASFIDLANYHKGANSALFAKTTWPEPALTAVIDYHPQDAADNCQHKIHYAFPLTDEFKAWVVGNGKPLNKIDFAAFVEDHIADMAVADLAEDKKLETLFRTRFAIPTEMVELSRGLRVNVAERVTNAFMMQSGESELQFSSEHTNAKGEKLVVPGLFMLCLPIFIDGSLVRIPARLRYRVVPGEGTILWTYQLYRWGFFLRERVQSDFAIAVKQTALPAFEGAPEA